MLRKYIDLVKDALLKIESNYYRLSTTYEPSGIIRERVFCYELYHQIRSNMTSAYKLSLNGEIDKRGHINFERRDQKNPDFVFHIPGQFEGNTLVIEVKGNLLQKQIMKDFRTILTFINKYQYKAGIFILYNYSFDELKLEMGQKLKTLKTNPAAKFLFILTIKKPKGYCEENILSEVNV